MPCGVRAERRAKQKGRWLRPAFRNEGRVQDPRCHCVATSCTWFAAPQLTNTHNDDQTCMLPTLEA